MSTMSFELSDLFCVIIILNKFAVGVLMNEVSNKSCELAGKSVR